MNNLRGKKEAAQNDTRSPIFFNYPAGARQDPGIRRNTSATSIRMSNNNDAGATAETNEHNEALIEEQEREARDRKKKEKRRRRERAKREKERMRRNQTKSDPPATAPVQQSSETAGRVLDHINLLSDEEEVMNQDINEGKKKNRKTKRKYY